MKKSNKLLIALAISLIIIPIIVVAVNVKLNYRDEKTYRRGEQMLDHFATTTEGYASMAIAEPFNNVEIADAKGRFLNIQIIKDSQSGIKVSDLDKDAITYKVDDQGTLRLDIKDVPTSGGFGLSLIIYVHNLNQVSVAKGSGLSLISTVDSLTLNANALNVVEVQSPSRMNKITIIADGVAKLHFSNNFNISEANLGLNNTNFETEWTSYEQLQINATGNSNLNIAGEEQDQKKFQIENLYIKTEGKSDVRVENIQVNKSSGNLSDSTAVSMSASILKTMFNK
ncbi:hypothetical protein [Pedobacter sandarakinus]|uniref:hypothetical protein n=1 Tax=Pedobacter sandarakinus TaxID=353156 RepID=UPI0022450A70|nr:hypothetical protein [Pedobacter sandarakinus]MCX2573482.1 hypothetical protein [Pedobacter sandarakinus]